MRRRAIRREAIAPAAEAVLEARTDDLVLSKIDGDHVRHALEQLPREHHELIEMGFFAGISHSEIARIIALPVGEHPHSHRPAPLASRVGTAHPRLIPQARFSTPSASPYEGG